MANPVALILSSSLMLEHVGENRAAARVTKAVHKALEKGKKLTSDLGGKGKTTEITEEIIENL